jgi:hypothetical protein
MATRSTRYIDMTSRGMIREEIPASWFSAQGLRITNAPPIGEVRENDRGNSFIPTMTDLRRSYRRGRPSDRFHELDRRRTAAICAGLLDNELSAA